MSTRSWFRDIYQAETDKAARIARHLTRAQLVMYAGSLHCDDRALRAIVVSKHLEAFLGKARTDS